VGGHRYFECRYSKCCYFEYRDLSNVMFSGVSTQTCYCIWGFHRNILYVAKICTISEKNNGGVSLQILELFRLKPGWSYCLCTTPYFQCC